MNAGCGRPARFKASAGHQPLGFGCRQHQTSWRVRLMARRSEASHWPQRHRDPRPKQKTRQTRRFRCLDIGRAIANDKASVTSYRPVLHQVVYHARARLSPMVIFKVADDRSLRMVRAISNVVDARALRGEFGAHPFVRVRSSCSVKNPRATPD